MMMGVMNVVTVALIVIMAFQRIHTYCNPTRGGGVCPNVTVTFLPQSYNHGHNNHGDNNHGANNHGDKAGDGK